MNINFGLAELPDMGYKGIVAVFGILLMMFLVYVMLILIGLFLDNSDDGEEEEAGGAGPWTTEAVAAGPRAARGASGSGPSGAARRDRAVAVADGDREASTGDGGRR